MKNLHPFLALALGISLGACSSKPKAAKPKPPEKVKAPETTKAPDKPVEELKADTQVSPALAVSGDIAAACGITALPHQDVNPEFAYDKEDLLAEDRAVLEKIATCLTTGALKGRSVQLVGRADPRGTDEYNMGLGSKRANSVGQYLGRLGVPNPQRAETTRGALDASGSDEAGWKKDRRVDIVLASPST